MHFRSLHIRSVGGLQATNNSRFASPTYHNEPNVYELVILDSVPTVSNWC